MKKSSLIWKELDVSQIDKSFVSNKPRGKSQSQRFSPLKSRNSSDLQNNIRALGELNLNCSEVKSVHRDDVDKSKSLCSKSLVGPDILKSKNKESFFSNLKKKEPTFLSLAQTELSPRLGKQKLEILDKSQFVENSLKTKHLINSSQENQFLQEELKKLKKEFLRFKELVQAQITKQSEEMYKIMREVYKQFDRVIERSSKQRIRQIETISEDNQNLFEAQSSISEIKKLDKFVGNNKLNIEKIFGEFNIKFDQSMNHKVEEFKGHLRNRSEGNFLEKLGKHKSEVEFYRKPVVVSPKGSSLFEKNRKQFQKLFEAIGNLKNDIDDWKVTKVGSNQRQRIKSVSPIELKLRC